METNEKARILAMYLGCDVYVFPAETWTNGWLKDQLVKLPSLQYKYKLVISNLQLSADAGYLPILRDLSSMTEEEAKELFILERASKYVEWTEVVLTKYKKSKLDELDGLEPSWMVSAKYKYLDGRTGGMSGSVSLREFEPKQFQYLLSKHFDIFDLFSKGHCLHPQDLK